MSPQPICRPAAGPRLTARQCARQLGYVILGVVVLAVPATNAKAATHRAATTRRAKVGTHYAKVVPGCAAPKPGHASCYLLRRVPATASTDGAESYVVRASYAVGLAGGYTPQDLWTAYGLGSAATLEAAGGIGSTQTVGIVDAYDVPNIEADLATFDAQYSLPACTTANSCFKKVNQTGGSTPPAAAGTSGWDLETSLDVEAVHATCPNCKIVLVEANSNGLNDLGAAVNQAVAQGATEVSNSFGSPEGNNLTFEGQFTHTGVVMTAGTGDNGYYNWDKPSIAAKADIPAAFPEVVAAGGTSLYLNADGTRASERVWNDDTGPNASVGYVGGSGGGCSTLFAAKSWQAAAAGYSAANCSGERLDADVSALADPLTGFDVYDSYVPPGGSAAGWITVGGTSLSGPLISSFYALAGGAQNVDYPSKTLYQALSASPSSLYDVTAGGNGYCDGGVCTPPDSRDDCGGTRACDAATGFDGPSGVGTPAGLGALAPVLASFTLPSSAPAGSVDVDASASTALSDSGAITNYKWDWGDGTTTNTATPQTSHNFTQGVYTVTLTVSTASATSVPHTASIAVGFSPPSNTGPPSFTGTPASLQTLTAVHGTYTGSPTAYTYQWSRCDSAGAACADIPGATSQIYTLIDADVGHRLVVTETASNPGGPSAPATSGPTAVVAAAAAPDTSAFGHAPGTPTATGADPHDVAISSAGIIAVTNEADDTVSTFTTGPDGSFVPVAGSPFALGDFNSLARGASFSPDGKQLVVVGGGYIQVLAVSASGALSPLGPSIGLGLDEPGFGPNTITYSPNGKLIATANTENDRVHIYAVSPTGELGDVAGSPVSVGGPSQAKFSPAGNLLAVSTRDTNRVFMYSVSPGGALTAAPGSPHLIGGTVRSVAFSPGGRWLAAGSAGVSMFSVGSDGSLTAVSGSPFTSSVGAPVDLAFSPTGLLGIDGGLAVEVDTLDANGVPSISHSAYRINPTTAGSGVSPSLAFGPGGLLAATYPAANQVVGLLQGAYSPPDVTTSAASSVAQSSATLAGTVNPRRKATTYHFVYGTTTSYGITTADTSAGASATAVGVSAPVTALAQGLTYHYALEATNVDGTTRSADQTFTTASPSSPGGGSQGTTPGGGSQGTKPAGGGSTSKPSTGSSPTVTTAQVVRALAALRGPSGKSARISSILRSGGWTYRYTCLRAGRLSVTWTAGKVVVATGVRQCARAGSATLRVKLSAKGKSLLKRAHKNVSLKVRSLFGVVSKSSTLVLRH
jgi:6-phosphogluconolactonase (cycloisomerase 2 family)